MCGSALQMLLAEYMLSCSLAKGWTVYMNSFMGKANYYSKHVVQCVMMLMVEGDCDGSMMCRTYVIIASTCEWCAGGGESTGEAAPEDCPIPGHTWGSGQHVSG